METIFSSILRHTCLCQLYFFVQWKRIFKCIPVSGKGFSGQWKWFFIYFQTFLPLTVFFWSIGNVVLERILPSGQWKPFFFLVLVKAFSVLCKLIFLKTLHSGQWKQFFDQLQTLCFYSELFSAGEHNSSDKV